MKTFLLSLMLFTLLLSAARPVEHLDSICLVPLAGISPAQVQLVKKAIADFYQVPVEVMPLAQLPASAMCPVRHRYRARAILSWVATQFPAVDGTSTRYLALTTADIEVENPPKQPHWGVFGLARYVGADQCVVSTFRMQGRADRLIKVSLHEIGHTLYMPHCLSNTTACFMNDAHGKVATVDAAQVHLCEQCREKLRW
jgi:archaemetzincin